MEEEIAISKSPLSCSSSYSCCPSKNKNYRTKLLALCCAVVIMWVPQCHGDGAEEIIRMKYELVGKACGKAGDYYAAALEAALAAVEEAVATGSSRNGFYEAGNAAVRAAARCHGDLWGCDCEECVAGAVELVREECRRKPAGEVYLDACSVTYSTYSEGDKNGSRHGKLIAIVLGGAASLGLGFIIFIGFFKSCGQKDDDY
ncbi:cysteine-rich repeat secretory protein 39-like [Momordica charantia]|uniref:Cysteine-rich repeat secretory protein 39-like n=1 Tax=Momordica charantia TaxID=3673 RepID=A0A6J1D6V6_MOMCH|nr:cysteine-rich repeat secretory protein 39-like [Momordica charantia]